jgi:succinoglycan biosynthesis transport protein ExoP
MSPPTNLPRYPVAGSAQPQQHMAAVPQAYLHPGLSLTQIRTILHAYRRQSAMILFGVVLAVGLISMILPRTYKATATLMVDFNVNDPLGGKEFPTGLMTNYLSTQRDLIQSPAVLLPAIAQAKLTADAKYTAGWHEGKGDIADWVMDRMMKGLKVEVGNYGSQLIYITYSANSAAEAARIANVIAHVYADQQLRRLNDPAGEQAQRYQAQLDQLKQNVDDAQTKVTEFRQRTGLVEFDSKQDLGGDRLANLEQRLVEAQQQRRAAQAHASTGGVASATKLTLE